MDRTVIKPFEEIEYKVYGYTLPEVPSHDGYVKIGDTTRDAVTRVFEQVGTAGLNPDILFEKLARKSDGKWFRDKELHRYLKLNGIERKDFNGRADEWFYFNGTLEKAEELTDKFIERDYEEIQISDNKFDYVLRNEQQQAVEKTLEYYHSEDEEKEFLWNAKPRFGKTLTTYDFIRNLQTTNVLIVTNRPAIANSWYDDFKKFISWQEPQIKFVSETEALNGKAMSYDQYLDYLDTSSQSNPSQIAFISLQDLKGAKFAGGRYEKLDWVAALDWDVLVIDEAHEGIDTKITDRAFSQIKRKFTLHLSGTPFKALANNKFHENQIFNWSYVDEQQAKEDWDESLGSNPYESLPTLNLFTYQMSKMVEEEVTDGLQIGDETNIDYAFDLNEFFRVKNNGKFEYEESVIRYLDNLSSGKFPFSENQYRNELNHTFWLLPRVKAAKALQGLLKSHQTFKDYKVVLAAGDGVSIQEDLETEALDVKENTKSFDKVREAIERYDKTITLSVGQLTTGVTIPEWTAVFMLNNIESPSLYFQAAFRSQNPYEFEQDGNLYRKENAYIFDFSPDRTLRLYDDFANNLTSSSSKTSSERKSKIKKLLNFFPVIAEDEEGSMHEIDASEVLAIPSRITSREVVKRGFMSNLLFANISGIFSSNSPFKEILDKIPPEKNKRKENRREIPVTNPSLNEEDEIEIPEDIVVGRSTKLFGEKIYAPIEIVEEVTKSIDEAKEKQKESIKRLAGNITNSLVAGFDKLKDDFKLTKGRTNDIKKSVHISLEELITDKYLTMTNEVRELTRKYEQNREEAFIENNEEEIEAVMKQYKEKKQEIKMIFSDEINKEIEKTIHTIVEEEFEKVEGKKKKTTEDDVRDHLRGFSRTIPAFLMAYGDEDTRLANFEENIDEATFEDLTSITIEEFKSLRDGFEYENDNGEIKTIPGLFNEVVFNASVREFNNTKERLANYFDESLEEDIFVYISPQKTNQIFTPRAVVKMMVDALERENPGIFKDKTKKFADLYVKSGLYITEIVKKLNQGLKEEIPNEQERIKWILENQVYACAPSNIIYNITKNFIYNNVSEISTDNLIEVDTMKLANEGKLANEIYEKFGDDSMKFDVIIGNPPFSEDTKDTSDNPIYHLFLDESYLLSEKVMFITPARFLFNAGKTPKSWNRKMLDDPHLKVVFYEQKGSNVFNNTSITGGVAVTYRDKNKDFGAIDVFTIYPELDKIMKKVKKDKGFESFSNIIYSAFSYKFTPELYKDYPEIETRTRLNNRGEQIPLISKGHKYDLATNILESLDFVVHENKSEVSSSDIKLFGRVGTNRVYRYIKRKYIKDNGNLDFYKVFVPKANGASGQIVSGEASRIISMPALGDKGVAHTNSFISIGKFETEEEAKAALKYVKTKFARVLLGVLKVTQDNQVATWSKIPNQDFTSSSDINWNESIPEIDQQLYEKYDLSPAEVKFIEEHIVYLKENE